MAHSADGFIGRKGIRTPMTSDAGWKRVYADRAKADAVMIGIETANTDNPGLTSHGAGRDPVRIVIDTHARLDPASRMAQTARDIPTWVITVKDNAPALEALGVHVITAPALDGHIDLDAALAKLDVGTIICEGGARLAQSLNTYGLIDELILIEATQVVLGEGIPLPVLTNFTPVSEEQISTDTWRSYVKRSS
jgi:diaminohydroxyphosphoribosylaminopyrimidine deaminase/5-amino-6-(5-phosphoribosylamino)uracil reductase